MTFSQRVKNQICELADDQICCQQALMFGILFFSRGYVKDTISFHTENKAVAYIFATALAELTGASVSITTPLQKTDVKRRLYTVLMEDEQDKEMVLSYISEQYDEILKRVQKQKCCKRAFITGAFLIAGTIIDPEKEYHLEFSFTNEETAKVLYTVLKSANIAPRSINRRGDTVLYYKNSEEIEELLTLMGAVESTFELMNLKIEKDMRNKVNRIMNCENANVDKTIKAAVDQINAINIFIENHGFYSIPQELREIARVRLDNPQMSLSEMCKVLPFPISRSTLSRKLKKLSMINEEYEK